MEGEKNFNKIPPPNRADIERKKLIDLGIITPEESEMPKSEMPKKEEAPMIELTPEMEVKEDSFKIDEEMEKSFFIPSDSILAELPEMKLEKETESELEQEEKVSAVLKEFGIEQEDLKEIKEFDRLSYGQKLLVAENLKQLTLGRIQEEAALKYRENSAKSKFLGRVWKTISKKYQIAKLEKTTAEEIAKGGIKIHKETLQQLINGQRETGLEVIEKEGKLEIQYAAGFKDLSPEEQKLVENFNKIATEFSQIPDEWRLKTANKKDRGKYKEIFEQYEKTKGQLLELRLKKNNNDETEASLYFNNIDHEVTLNQFLNTHPEVEEQLQKIKEKAPLRKVLSDIVTERGLYFAAGAVTRSVTMNLFGLVGIPLAAAGLGGFLAGKRAKETLIEEEKMMRRGGQRTRKEISKEEKKNIIKAAGINQKFDRLIGQIELSTDEKRRKELLGRLEIYADATEARIVKGWINFGKAPERLKNQLDLIQACSRARVYLASDEKEVKSVLKINLEEILNLREKKISKKQRDYILKQAVKGAFWGATFALAGYTIRHFAGEWFGSGKIKSEPSLEDIKTRGAGLKKHIDEMLIREHLEELATIQKGEGIEHVLIRQLTDKPEEFGFKGNIDDVTAIKQWVGSEAHRMAIKAGYVDMATGKEIRVGADGIGKAAYVVEKNTDGSLKITEYLKDTEDGKFNFKETHELAKDFKEAKFEGADKEFYEYESDEGGSKPSVEVGAEEISPDIDESIKEISPSIFKISTEKLLNPLETAQADKQAVDLINKIIKGELTADDFSNTYANKFGATGGMTPELKANLAKLFENLKGSNPMVKRNAETVFKTIMRRLFAIKES